MDVDDPSWTAARFGAIALNRLTWQDVEELFAAMRHGGAGADWVRRCATVLFRGLDLARNRGLLRPRTRPRMPFRPRTTPNQTARPNSRGEVQQLLAAARDHGPRVRRCVILILVSHRNAEGGVARADVARRRFSTREEIHVDAAITDGGPGKRDPPQINQEERLARRPVDGVCGAGTPSNNHDRLTARCPRTARLRPAMSSPAPWAAVNPSGAPTSFE